MLTGWLYGGVPVSLHSDLQKGKFAEKKDLFCRKLSQPFPGFQLVTRDL